MAACCQQAVQQAVSQMEEALYRAHAAHERAALGLKHSEENLMRRGMAKVPRWQRPSSAPAPPQGAPGGSGQLNAPRKRPAYWALELAASKAADPHRL